MSLGGHLAELRKRVLFAVLGILVGGIAAWFFYEPIFEALQAPLIEAAKRQDAQITVNFSGIASALDTRLKVSFFLGILASSPWWLYQLWGFVAPGLKKRERRYTTGFLGAAVPLFAAGVTLAWLILPHAVEVLTAFVPAGSSNLNDAQMYLTFAMRLLLAFGLAFVFPVIMVALTWARIVSARRWLAGWRWAIVGIFAFAAAMTPTPDAITMILVALPMCALYFGAIGVGVLRERTQKRSAS